MNTINLEELGITQEQITNKVVDHCAERLLSTYVSSLDEEGNVTEYNQNSPLAKELERIFKARIDAALSDVVERHILPNVSHYIENVTLQETNRWGEAAGKRVTFLEYLAARAEAYMTEQVDFQGKSKSECSGYSWSGTQTRITAMIHKHLHYSIDRAMQEALKNGLSLVTKGLAETAKIKLEEVAAKLKVEVTVPR